MLPFSGSAIKYIFWIAKNNNNCFLLIYFLNNNPKKPNIGRTVMSMVKWHIQQLIFESVVGCPIVTRLFHNCMLHYVHQIICSCWWRKNIKNTLKSLNNTDQKLNTIYAHASTRTMGAMSNVRRRDFYTSGNGTTCNTFRPPRFFSHYTLTSSKAQTKISTAMKEQ